MKSYTKIAAILLIFTGLLFSACGGGGGGDDGGGVPTESSDKSITYFSFAAIPSATVIINDGNKTIAVTVPNGTIVTSLVPTITITGVNVSPNTGVAQDFSSSRTYTVTAEDDSTQDYLVTVTVAPSSAKAITAFSFNTTPVSTGVITEASHTIAVTVPFGTNVTTLIPAITHTGASISPASGASNSFTAPQIYTVTAADSSTQAYTVTVTVSASSAKQITSFTIYGTAATIDQGNRTIFAAVSGTNLTNLIATFVTTGSSVKIGAVTQISGSTSNNFTNAVTYIVTAADGSTQTYQVVLLPPPSALSGTVIGQTRIDLTWTDNSSQETGYSIERKTGSGGTYAVVATVSTNAISYSDTTLAANTNYYYRVRAVHSMGNSIYCTQISNTTYDYPPNAPSGLTLTSIAFNSVPFDPGFNLTFSWVDNSNNEDWFYFANSTDNSNWRTGLFQAASNSTTNQVTVYYPYGGGAAYAEFSENSTYYLKVYANNSGGNSLYSNTLIVITPLYAPRYFMYSGYQLGTYRPFVGWNCVSTQADGYKIERCTDNVNYVLIATVAGASTHEYMDTTAARTTHYYYRIRSYKGTTLYSEYVYTDFITD